MCFYRYQATHLVAEHGLEKLFPEWSKDELIEEVSECAGASFGFGPVDFADAVKREAVVGWCIVTLMDFRRCGRDGKGKGKRWYEYQLDHEDQVLTALEQQAFDECERQGDPVMTPANFVAEVAAFNDRRELQEKYGE